jgi:predicted nucleic acid-binding protein
VLNPTLRAVLDTCILKLATLSNPVNRAALIVELALRRRIEMWASPAMLEEYTEVLAAEPEFLSEVTNILQIAYPLTLLRVIHHEPDNRILECALAVQADWLITVNTSRGHFDRKAYEGVRVVTPGEFLNHPEVDPLLKSL